MPKTPKLQTLDQLKQHIDAHAEKTGTGFTYDKFVQAMGFEISTLKLADLARCNYRTMQKWVSVYNHERNSEL